MQEQELLQIRTSVARLSREMGKDITNQRMSVQYRREAKRFSSDDTDGALAVSKLAKEKKSPRPLTRQRSFTSPADIPKFKDLVAEFKKQYSPTSNMTSSDEYSDLDSARSSNTSGTAEKSPRSPQDKEFMTPTKSKKDLDKKAKDKSAKKDKEKAKHQIKDKKAKDKGKDKIKDKKPKDKESKSSKTDKDRKDLTNSSKSIDTETQEAPPSLSSSQPDSDSISMKPSPSSLNGSQLRLSFSQQLRRHSSANIKNDIDSPSRPTLKLSSSRGSLLSGERIESPKPKDITKKDKKKDKDRQDKDKGVSFGAIATIRDAGDDTKVVCFVGNRVGKTALLERILADTSSCALSPSKQRKSIIIDVDTPQGPKKIEMQDTSSADASSDVYYTIKCYSEPEYFVFVYSFDDKESLREIPKHVNAVRTVKQSKSIPLILVGNKCDLENKEVKVAEAEAMAYSLRCAHVTVSAKTGENVIKLVEQVKYLTKLAVNENDLSDSVDSESSSLELHFKSPRSRLLTRNSKKKLVEVPINRECKEFVSPIKSPENVEINYVNAKKKYVFTSHFSCIRVWDIDSGKLLTTIDQIKPTGQLEVKSNLLYFINGNEIVTWDIKKLGIAHRFTIEDHTQITRFLVHDFGLFCGDMEGNCWAWTTDGSALKLEGHSTAISSIAVIEEMVIAGAASGALLGWHLAPEVSAINRFSLHSPKSLNSSVTPPQSPSPSAFSLLSSSASISSPPNSPWTPSPLASYDPHRAFTVISSSRTFSGHTGLIMGLTEYNHALYSSSTDESVRAWDISTGECLEEYHRKSITAMPESFRLGFNNMSDNGIVFVISDNDPSLVAFKLKSGAVVSAYQGHRSRITSLQFTSHHLFSGSEDSSIRVWDIKDAECLIELRGHRGRVGSLSLRQERDKTMLFSGGEDGVLRLWDLTTLLQKKKD